ncbi:MAG TPA: DEAD/DEAH box helicase [Candidatus Limnocylindrales bacterium]
MDVIHAAWGLDRRLHLWAEDGQAYADLVGGRRAEPTDGRHPFAARTFSLAVVGGEEWPLEASGRGVELRLPSRDGLPLPSPSIAPTPSGPNGDTGLESWSVPSAAQDARGCLRLLLALPDRPRPAIGPSLRLFARAAWLGVELAARGRFLPVIEGGRAARGPGWRPAPGAGDVGRLGAIAGAMPAAALAARPDLAADSIAPRLVVDEFLAAIIGELVGEAARTIDVPRANAALRLILGRSSVRSTVDDGAVRRALDRWSNAVRPAEGPFRTLFRLREPGRPERDGGKTPGRPKQSSGDGHVRPGADATPSATWKVELLLGARDDPSLIVPAGVAVRDRSTLARVAGADPESALLVDLARASRLYPPLEATLQAAVPADLELDTPGAHAFLRDGAPLLSDAGYTVLLPAWWRQRRRRIGLRLRARPRTGPTRTGVGPGLGKEALVDYDWRIAIGDQEMSEAELAELAHVKGGLVWVRGEWVEIESGELAAALRAVEGRPGGGGQPPLTVADVIRTAFGLLPAPGGLDVTGVEAEDWLAALLAGDDGARPAAIPTPPGFGGMLRPYQERGLGWLAFLDRLGFGGILADDMGLGKTAQLLALLVAEQSNVPPAERLGPTLVVCPMSVVGNWQREAARFGPSLSVYVHHGAGRLGAGEIAAAMRGVDVVVTTYALLARDRPALSVVPWRRVVLDEAQEVKNSDSEQSRAARSLRAASRIALTGTPIENRLTELWAIMDFANPGLLGSESAFRRRFSVPIERWSDESATERLRGLTAPFILRRLKTDRSIVPDLPDKLEFGVTCNLTREQATLYQAVVDELLPDLEQAEDEQEYRGKVLRAIVRLKQVCNHPALFLADGSSLRGRSGKLERLEEILDQIVATGERALVFTQFTEWAERLVPYLRERFGVEVLYLHGGLARRNRDALVERFEGGSVPIFVLSLKAGGKGINLVAANHVLHYDRWWNPAVEDQASDRAYRIGQVRDVQVRTFVSSGTLEEKIADMLAAKRDLAERIVRAGERAFTELSTAELRAVLALDRDAVGEDLQ